MNTNIIGVKDIIAAAVADTFGVPVRDEHRVAAFVILDALRTNRIAVVDIPEVTLEEGGRRVARCPLSYPRSTGKEAKVVIDDDYGDGRKMLASPAVPSPICPRDARLYAAALLAAADEAEAWP